MMLQCCKGNLLFARGNESFVVAANSIGCTIALGPRISSADVFP